MALLSDLLSGNPRLDQAAAGPPSIKKRPPDDDPEAIKSIQLALVELGFALPVSVKNGEADGVFGEETYNAVMAFQKKVFPGQWQEWDGRVGANTLAKMDEMIPRREPNEIIPATWVHLRSHCLETEPESDVVASSEDALPNRGVDRSQTLPGRG